MTIGITASAGTILAPTDTAGAPRSPSLAEMQRWGVEVEALLNGVMTNVAVFDTRSNLNADLAWPANTMAWVVADATASNIGLYRKSGASGSGSWARIGDIPYNDVNVSQAIAAAAEAAASVASASGYADDAAESAATALGALSAVQQTEEVFDGGSSSYTLSYTPESEDVLTVIVHGVVQPNGDYVLTGDVIDFGETVPAGTGAVVVRGRVAAGGAAAATSTITGHPVAGEAGGFGTESGVMPLAIDDRGMVTMPSRAMAPKVATFSAFGAVHLALAPANSGSTEYSGFYTLRSTDAAAIPLQWSPYRQFAAGPVEIADDRVWCPAPMSHDGLGAMAVYPWSANVRRAAAVDGVMRLLIVAGQSLGEGSESGGPAVSGVTVQGWAAQRIFGGVAAPSNLWMFNGGLFKPGASTAISVPSINNTSAQSSLVAAADSLHVPGSATNTPVPIYNSAGTQIATGYTHSSSKVLAAIAGLSWGADAASPFGTDWAGVNLSYGGQSINYFIPAADGGVNGLGAEARWYDDIYITTIERYVTAATAAGKTARVEYIDRDQIQADHNEMTAAQYRTKLDLLCDRLISGARAETGQTTGPYILQEQATLWCSSGNIYGRPVNSTSPLSHEVLAKGISTDTDDADYVITGPAYMWRYVGGYHLETVSYTERAEKFAYVATADAAKRARGAGKWMPVHVTGVRLEGAVLIATCHVEHGPLVIDTDTLPLATGWGFELAATTGTVPSILACEIASNGFEVRLTLSSAWSGTGREVRIADTTSDAAGWRTDDLSPATPWQHQGARTNIRDSAPWSSRVTGARLANWLCHQIVTIAD